MTWDSSRLTWWCLDCLGFENGGFLGEGDPAKEMEALARIAKHKNISHVLECLKVDIPSIDISDPAMRLRVENALKDGTLDMMDEVKRYWFAEALAETQERLIPLNGDKEEDIVQTTFMLPANIVGEDEDDEAWFTSKGLTPDQCNGCGGDGQENLIFDHRMGMYGCISCDTYTPPAYDD
jgi:hypothetical protein